jgi:serine/threonine protein kinase
MSHTTHTRFIINFADVAQYFARKLLPDTMVKALDWSDNRVKIKEIHQLWHNPGCENLVKVFQVCAVPDSPYYAIDMEWCVYNLRSYLDSRYLRSTSVSGRGQQRLRANNAEKGLYGIEVCDIMLQAVHGIAYLHRSGVVYRNLKPENGNF